MFKAFISSEQTGHLVLRERPSAESAVLRPLFGLFPLGVGCLITYVLLSGGGPMPVGSLGARIMGQVVVAVFFSVLGLLPLAWGLSELFVRGSFALRPMSACWRNMSLSQAHRFGPSGTVSRDLSELLFVTRSSESLVRVRTSLSSATAVVASICPHSPTGQPRRLSLQTSADR